MAVTPIVLCALIYLALGVRAGWSARLGLLVPLAASAVGASLCFRLDLAMAAVLTLLLNTAAQGGFVLGVVSSSPEPSHRPDR